MNNSMDGQMSSQMAGRSFLTRSAEETMELGRQVARQLAPPVVVLLVGDLGAGKTTFAKGLVAGLGAAAEKEVTSPTFTLVQEYGPQQENALRVYHVDLYRIENQRDLETLGLEDLTAERSVVIVEWGQKLGVSFETPWPGSPVIEVRMEAPMEAMNDTERRIEIHPGRDQEPRSRVPRQPQSGDRRAE